MIAACTVQARSNASISCPGGAWAGKYEIERPLGSGYEGEVYAIVERSTGIRRAAKFYYPHRDPMGKAAIAYARKLDALRHCPILMQYHHQEVTIVRRKKVIVVISELVEGDKLSEFLTRNPTSASPRSRRCTCSTSSQGNLPHPRPRRISRRYSR